MESTLGFQIHVLSWDLANWNTELLNPPYEIEIASDSGQLNQVEVTTPNGSENWQMGSSETITWNDNISSNVEIELYRSGTLETTIISSTASDGTYSWSIPTGLTASSSYKVKIIDTANSSLYDYSDDNFTISSGAPTGTCTDSDGITYETIILGSQVWMAENLKTTHYNNGEPISTGWPSYDGAYAVYDNDPSNAETYGNLYNWYAVDDSRGVCPEGFHMPSDDEWQILIDYLGGYSVAGGKMKETGTAHWNSPNTGATNESGFTALPGGYRSSSSGYYSDMGDYGSFWSSTAINSNDALYRALHYLNPAVFRHNLNKRNGFSVRCLGD